MLIFKPNVMKYLNRTQAKKVTGLSYLGMVNNSAKHEKAYTYNEMVYTLYLSPAKSSGYEVCPGRTDECTLLCLNESGRNKMKSDQNRIPASRKTKTKLFFENKEFFVSWVIDEITAAMERATRLGYRFSVRLNNTSDISPEDFVLTSASGTVVNLLELFPDVQFYDYSKLPERAELVKKYPNYDLTFSYTGYNWDMCQYLLSEGIRVAAVFEQVPETYRGYQVIPGDKYDMRYLDPKNVIVGLKFKKVRNKIKDNYKFVIR